MRSRTLKWIRSWTGSQWIACKIAEMCLRHASSKRDQSDSWILLTLKTICLVFASYIEQMENFHESEDIPCWLHWWDEFPLSWRLQIPLATYWILMTGDQVKDQAEPNQRNTPNRKHWTLDSALGITGVASVKSEKIWIVNGCMASDWHPWTKILTDRETANIGLVSSVGRAPACYIGGCWFKFCSSQFFIVQTQIKIELVVANCLIQTKRTKRKSIFSLEKDC